MRGIQPIPSKGARVLNGRLYFLPSMTFRFGIIQLLCESPSNLSLTVCTDLLDQNGRPSLHEKRCGPLCRCLLSDKLVSRGFSAPGSSVKCTGVPGLSLRSRVRVMVAGPDGFPPGIGKLLSPQKTTCSGPEPTEVDERVSLLRRKKQEIE